MSSRSRKRSRTVVDENRADCPFAVTLVADPAREAKEPHKLAKKRKPETADEGRRVFVQDAPFKPAGKFRSNGSLAQCYDVEPRKQWQDMTRYISFVLNGVKYLTDDFVYVANETTIERQSLHMASDADGSNIINDYWVARILEIRASDEHHVYARVYWMYWPEELPPGTMDGKKVAGGRQAYHGQHELVASNHMDVINVVSVVMAAKVNQWVETDDDEVQDGLYWRQGFDSRTLQLSSVETVCKCSTPANPDKMLVGCSNSQCEKWMHYECLLDDVLRRLYDRWGTDIPHVLERLVKMEDVEPNGFDIAHVKEEESKSPNVESKTVIDSLAVMKQDERTPSMGTPTPQPQDMHRLGRLAVPKQTKRRKSTSKKSYEGLFAAELKMSEGPTIWEITDLREGITGGDKTWTESAYCLVCDSIIT